MKRFAFLYANRAFYCPSSSGLNYWPIEDVVIKFDYQDQDVPAGKNEFDGFNLGIGYQF